MYEVCVIPEKGAPALELFTVYETSFPTDSHVMVTVVNVLELFTCVKFVGAGGGPEKCLKRSVVSMVLDYNTLAIHHCIYGVSINTTATYDFHIIYYLHAALHVCSSFVMVIS